MYYLYNNNSNKYYNSNSDRGVVRPQTMSVLT